MRQEQTSKDAGIVPYLRRKPDRRILWRFFHIFEAVAVGFVSLRIKVTSEALKG